jgi:hypothetical protein
VVCAASPRWIVESPAQVRGRRVLVVDEICSSAETLQMIRQRTIDMGAYSVRSAVLFAQCQAADIPDYIGIITDALVLNPWDREIVRDGALAFHPEYTEALVAQGVTCTDELRLLTPVFTLAKSKL